MTSFLKLFPVFEKSQCLTFGADTESGLNSAPLVAADRKGAIRRPLRTARRHVLWRVPVSLSEIIESLQRSQPLALHDTDGSWALTPP